MSKRTKSLDIVFKRLKQRAAALNLELHPSFRVELENYAGHDIIKDLDAKDLRIVVTKIGERAINRKTGKSRVVGGGAVRATVLILCENPFSDCSLGAQRVLQNANRTKAARDIRKKLDTRYGEMA
jgi:hypothetical protein